MDISTETESVQAAVTSILEHATEPLYLVRPSSELLKIFIETATDNDAPLLHVFAAEPELKAVRNHFLSASRAADLVEYDQLTLAPVAPEGWGTAVVTAEKAYTFAHIAGHEFVFETTAVPAGIQELWNEFRDAGKQFSLRTPPWSVVTATLTETFDAEVCADFTTSIHALDDLDTPAVNEVDSALLVGARHELLQYDLSKWTDDIQFYSKATFSRAKSDLEELGIIVCENVPVDVGRPRERLTLAEEYTSLSEAELLREVNALKTH
jgi:hypothetical protein